MGVDPYKYFRVEAREILDQLARGTLALEKGGAPDVVPLLLRLAHTLKGAARVVKLVDVSEHAHEIEDALAPFRGGEAVPRDRVDRVLHVLDAIEGRLASLAAPASDEGESAPPRPAEPETRSLRADVAELDALVDGASEARARLAAARRHADEIERVRQLAELLVGQLGAAPRVRSIADELVTRIAGVERELVTGLERVERELGQTVDAAERLRLVPADALFDTLARAARDAARSVGKRASFVAKGGDVRLDAHMLGIVQGALVQIVRNAVAHGIESEAERIAAGKPPEGRVDLEVNRAGNRVAFVCRDDGRGIDLDAVRRAVHKKGLLPSDAQSLDAEALLRLLFDAGITTSARVTDVAGRGIGLDVVRDAAKRLGGHVTARTVAGRGTTIELVAPLSLSSLDALLVESAGQSAAIPLDAVRRTVRLAASEIARAPEGDSIVHEGKLIPFAPLGRALRGVVATSTRAAWSTVVLERRGVWAAVGVDRLLGTANVVLRPVPALAPADPIVAGVALDAEGNPRLVLDAEELVGVARRLEPSVDAASRRPPILVVDDSLTTRMLEQSILESAGYDVDLATSGEEALDKARDRRYGLFLVDVEMPGMDGFTFIERARADAALRDVPAILVTSRSAVEDRERGRQVGARGYIVKSEFDQNDLIAKIRELVG